MSSESESEIVHDLIAKAKTFKAGDEWYILSAAWWHSWEERMSAIMAGIPAESLPPLGPINNNSILKEDYVELRSHNVRKKLFSVLGLEIPPASAPVTSYILADRLHEDVDFKIVPKAVWDLLVKRYDTVSIAAPRYVYHKRGTDPPAYEIDVYPRVCTFECPQRPSLSPAARPNISLPVEELKRMGMELFMIDYPAYREATKILIDGCIVNDTTAPISNFLLRDTFNVVIDIPPLELIPGLGGTPSGVSHRAFASIPVVPDTTTASRDSNRKRRKSRSPSPSRGLIGGRPMTQPGLCGLENLGNTCYMNSALQCLSNTVPLADYLVNGKYEAEVNTVNPIGSHGKVVRELAALFRHMWGKGNANVFAPRRFKEVIGSIDQTYVGYNQQDARGLVECVLTEVHEDVNRIKRKPYSEAPDYNGEPPEEWARQAWARYTARDDSFVTDTFTGQTVSYTRCPACGYEVVSFDPFRTTSVFIPYEAKVEVTLVFNGFHRRLGAARTLADPFKVLVPCPPGPCTARDFASAIAAFCNTRLADVETVKGCLPLAAENVVLADVRSHCPIVKQDNDLISAARPIMASFVDIMPPAHHCVRVAFSFCDSSGERLGSPYFVVLPAVTSYNAIRTELLCSSNLLANGTNLGGSDDLTPFLWIERSSDSSSITPDATASIRLTDSETLCVHFTDEGMKRLDSDFLWEAHSSSNSNSRFTSGLSSSSGHESPLTLEQCLRFKNNSTFTLDDDNKWRCSHCGKEVNALKQYGFWRLPPVMILCLNRFLSPDNSMSVGGKKLKDMVQFPVTDLDFSPFVQGPEAGDSEEKRLLYDLYAVSNHSGSLDFGHYTAYARSRLDGKWYLFNDSSVTPAKSPVTENAYILFYIRKDLCHFPSSEEN